jgi:hypothetical protein
MALQTFTAGQVLTAAQVNALQANDYNQTVSTKTASYVLVAADKGTRVVMNSASATTITVNTSLFSAGDTLFIQNIGAGVCTITAGTATVSTSGNLALIANAGGTLYFTSTGVAIFYASAAGTGGITLLNTTTFSAVASQSINDVFSATYDNYKIILNCVHSAGGIVVNLRYRVAGADNSTSNYQFSIIGQSNDGNPFFNAIGLNQTSTNVGTFYLTGNESEINVFSPFLAERTMQRTSQDALSSSTHVGRWIGAGFNAATSFTGFSLIPVSGTITGTVRVYGIGN